MSGHTPTPWRIVAHGSYVCEDDYAPPTEILGADDETVADNVRYYPTAIDPANAAFIVTAVNAHDELLSLCRRLAVGERSDEGHTALRDAAAALLAKHGGAQ